MNYFGNPTMNTTSYPDYQQSSQEGGFSLPIDQETPLPENTPDASYQRMTPNSLPPQGTTIPHYAKGGEVLRRGMEDVYMSPHEIKIMDKLQGTNNNYDKDGVKNYTGLWHIINHPHFMRAGLKGHYTGLHNHHAYASGGHVDDAPEGRFGDTKRVRMPKKMADMLDQILRQTGKNPSRNPKTGHREYFGLGGFFNGIGQQMGMKMPNPYMSPGVGGSNSSSLMGSNPVVPQAQMGIPQPQPMMTPGSLLRNAYRGKPDMGGMSPNPMIPNSPMAYPSTNLS